ncbi:hypothetical protein [Arthrobacter sp. M4]|uniref:hypothetical protein n=1 Tax=Arthrobacter sp. M4 TaxID=218160 RepID=UPI001CDC6DEA|nr:hypothetical protein [Arthrobacter sp. M4]MCA4133045.1 hypothetical protein [Arthrobacter sp. M4]
MKYFPASARPASAPAAAARTAAALAAVVLLAATGLLAGCSAAPVQPGDTATRASVRTQLPGLAAPSGEPDVPSLKDAHPQAGQAVRAAGPFDDRFQIDGLAFDGHQVKGTVRITSDVSDLLELQIVAGFYDAAGQLVGTARFEHHADDDGQQHAGPPEETQEFSIAVPSAAANTAVSAAVAVPVLVNE